MSTYEKRGFVSGIAIAAAMLATPAIAQDTDDGSGIVEILVTAQKRAERLQDVPVAVSAVTAAALAEQNINDTTALTRAVPSLQFQPGATSNGSGFRIRGIGTQLFSLGVEAAVSVVVDGVVSARQTQNFSDFADVERIEVLRGPQGTLFGKNATGGVINIVTARPEDSFAASFDATLAEKDEYRVKGTVTGPLSDTLRARISSYYNNVGGYVHNAATGKDINSFESWGLRGKLEWDATPDLNLLLSGDYRDSKSDCCNSVFVSVANPNTLTLIAPSDPSLSSRTINEDVISFNNDKQWTVSLEGNLDLGSATVTSITAFQNYKNVANNPVDKINNPSPVYIFGAGAFGPGLTLAKFDQNGGEVKLDQFSQELRISSNGDPDFSYVAGAYYSNLSLDRSFLRAAAACPTQPNNSEIGMACPNPTWFSSSLLSHNKTESIAAFGQIGWRVTGGLKLLGGLRVQHESTSVEGTKVGPDPRYPGSFALNAPNTGKRSASDTAITGKAGVQYEFSRNAQAYASYTRGYKGLGYNTELATNFAAQDAVKPEHVDAYELGFKGRTADGTLSIAVAAFIADYTNLQVQANRSDLATNTISNVFTNAGSSQTKGIEVEATLRPSDGFSVNFGLTYAKTKLDADGLGCPVQYRNGAQAISDNFPVNTCYRKQLLDSSGNVVATSGPTQDVRGGVLPYSPEVRLNLSPRYEMPLGNSGLTGVFQVGVNYQSKQYFALEQNPDLFQKGYALVDASIGLKGPDERWYVTGFVRNLFDKHYVTSLFSGSFPISTNALYQDYIAFISKESDRYVGINFGMKFD